jgi:hypothetical protein
VEPQLAVAHNFGIDFFVFDWYFNSTGNEPGDDLNSALNITHQLADRHGMQCAILYVNSPPFVVAPADWPIAINQWIGYMSDPAYVTTAADRWRRHNRWRCGRGYIGHALTVRGLSARSGY